MLRSSHDLEQSIQAGKQRLCWDETSIPVKASDLKSDPSQAPIQSVKFFCWRQWTTNWTGEWEEVLDLFDVTVDAQRWFCFSHLLSPECTAIYLERLPSDSCFFCGDPFLFLFFYFYINRLFSNGNYLLDAKFGYLAISVRLQKISCSCWWEYFISMFCWIKERLCSNNHVGQQQMPHSRRNPDLFHKRLLMPSWILFAFNAADYTAEKVPEERVKVAQIEAECQREEEWGLLGAVSTAFQTHPSC